MSFTIKKHQAEYYNADRFAKAIIHGDAAHHQLEPGEFYGELKQVVSGPVIVSTHSLNRTILQTGYAQTGYTVFLLPGNMSQDFSWRKQRLTGKRIGLLKSGMLHYSVLPPNFFGTPISLSNDYFKELIIKLSFDENLYQLIQQSEVVEIDPEEAYTIQKMVIDLCNSENPNPDVLINDLPVLLLKSIEKISKKIPIIISSSRDLLFNKALIYIEKNLNQALFTKLICEDIDTSERTLRYIFKEMTGLTPMIFVKNLRLNKVKKEIAHANKNSNIGEAAGKWGFNHSGQFAADYKKLFGEYPSETAGRYQ